MNQNDLTIELIMPSYNRLAVLKRTLAQVKLLYPDLNICLGLQGEMPDVEWKTRLSNDPLMRLETLDRPCTTITLNHCIMTSQADIVLVLDDDATPHFGWLESHRAAFINDPNLVYTSGRVVEFTRWRSALSDYVRILVEWFMGLFLRRDKKLNGRIVGWINWLGLSFTNQHLPGTCKINSPREGNMGIRRKEFIKVNGFSTRFVGNAWGFGADFGLRLAKVGKYGKYIGDAIIIHHEAPSGGSRAAVRWQWYKDLLRNHMIVIRNLGPQGWIGSIPRLIKYFLWVVRS